MTTLQDKPGLFERAAEFLGSVNSGEWRVLVIVVLVLLAIRVSIDNAQNRQDLHSLDQRVWQLELRR